MNTNENKQPKKKKYSSFNTILFIVLSIIIIYLLVKGFMWAWNTMAGWGTV